MERDLTCLQMCYNRCTSEVTFNTYNDVETSEKVDFKRAETERMFNIFTEMLPRVLGDDYCTGFMAP